MNQDLVMIGYMGLAGTEKLIAVERERLIRRLPAGFLEQAVGQSRRLRECGKRLPDLFFLPSADSRANRDSTSWTEGKTGMERKEDMAAACGIVKIWETGQEGFFQTLWRLSRSWETGFTVQLKEVPVRQETIEVCEILEVNPYGLDSDGCLWAAAAHGHRLCQLLKKEGIPAAVIGELTDSNDCLLIHDDTKSFLNRPQEEEYSRYLREKSV